MPSGSDATDRSGADRLVLRPPGPDDEAACQAAHRELAGEQFDFLLSAELPWAEQLAQIRQEASGADLPRGRVRADYLLAELDGEVVGRCSIRHELTPVLLEIGGHIGYAVRPAHRRRGYARRILQLAVRRCRALGIEPVLVTCDDDNLASVRVIEGCGGVLEDVRQHAAGHPPKRRYWIG